MSFVEEVKNKISSRANAEEFVKQWIRDRILDYTKKVGWNQNRAHLHAVDISYLLLKSKSGWSKVDTVDELGYLEVVQAIEFMIHFLLREGFQAETAVSSYGVDLTITWENN